MTLGVHKEPGVIENITIHINTTSVSLGIGLNMLSSIVSWFKKNDRLVKVLSPTKKIKVHGVFFTIRKINPLEYLAGSRALMRVYDVYQKKEAGVIDNASIEKVKAHYIDVLMAGVVDMNGLVLSRSKIDESEYTTKLWVENLLTDWSLAEELYVKILEFTYGKKKMKQYVSLSQS